MFKTFKNQAIIPVILTSVVLSITACNDENYRQSTAETTVPEHIKIGVVPGPYKDLLKNHLSAVVESKGHHLDFVEFSDWVQPDSALDAGEIDANLFQHSIYLKAIVENQGLSLDEVVNVPTLGLFAFSERAKTLDDLKQGALVALPNDAVNLSRALRFARDAGIITLKEDKDDLKASIADIDKNTKNLNFIPMEAAQLPRSLDSVDLALVPGNYAFEAKLPFDKALAKENVAEPIKLVVTVQKDRVNTVGAFLKEAVTSKEFTASVNADPLYRDFAKPKWWPNN